MHQRVSLQMQIPSSCTRSVVGKDREEYIWTPGLALIIGALERLRICSSSTCVHQQEERALLNN
jgi:hypothetical protein